MIGMAISQTLRLNVVLFTSLEHMPVVPISPLVPCVASGALLLGYSAAQPGLYHSVIPRTPGRDVEHISSPQVGPSTSSTPLPAVIDAEHIDSPQVGPSTSSTPLPAVHCACGRGAAKKDGRKFCQQAPNGNKSLCKCFTSSGGCTHRCKCVDCGNPYGTSGSAKQAYAHVTVPRYRPKQKLQELNNTSTSAEYLLKLGLNPVTGWSEMESFTLDCLVNYSSMKGLSIEPTSMHKCYSELQALSVKLGNFLQPKKLKQIQGKLQCINSVAEGFKALYRKQVELNWFT